MSFTEEGGSALYQVTEPMPGEELFPLRTKRRCLVEVTSNHQPPVFGMGS